MGSLLGSARLMNEQNAPVARERRAEKRPALNAGISQPLHVTAVSHVSAMVCQPTLVGMPANGGWCACQRWLACLPTSVGKSGDLDKYI